MQFQFNSIICYVGDLVFMYIDIELYYKLIKKFGKDYLPLYIFVDKKKACVSYFFACAMFKV